MQLINYESNLIFVRNIDVEPDVDLSILVNELFPCEKKYMSLIEAIKDL